eukprot:6485529-Amphidinium_carterae.2
MSSLAWRWGGRTLHIFNVYGYDVSYPDSRELNRSILDEMLPHAHALRDHPYVIGGDWNFEPDEFPILFARGDAVVSPPSDNKATSIPFPRKAFYKKVKAPPPEEENPEQICGQHWEHVRAAWDTSLSRGDVDQAGSCWNDAAVAALDLQPGDRGRLRVKHAVTPQLKKDPEVMQDLQRCYDLEPAWYQVQEQTLPLAHWPSAAGEYVATLEGQRARLEKARLESSRARQKA